MNKLNDVWKLICCPPRQHYIEEFQVEANQSDTQLSSLTENFQVQSHDNK